MAADKAKKPPVTGKGVHLNAGEQTFSLRSQEEARSPYSSVGQNELETA